MRRIAFEHKLYLSTRPFGLRYLSEFLIRHEIIPEGVGTVIGDIYVVLNQAVHGASVPIETAKTVVAIGEELLTFLSSIGARDGEVR
jgi:hypothetical protein